MSLQGLTSSAEVRKAEAPVYQSKWGYHATDYALYKKIKRCHALYWLAVRRQAAWYRWNARHPRNRFARLYSYSTKEINGVTRTVRTPYAALQIPEPKVCKFLEPRSQRGYHVRDTHGKEMFYVKDVQLHVPDFGILDWYETARRPYSLQSAAIFARGSLPLKEINKVWKKLERWYAETTTPTK